MRFDDLSGKIAIVTGAASGMGLAIARGLSGHGAKVIAADLDVEPPAALVEQAPHAIAYRRTDVSSSSQVRDLVESVTAQHGRLDILVNNAGINGPLKPLAEQADEAFENVFAVNVKGVFHGLKHGLNAMRENGGGVIINIASVQGIRPIYAGGAIYAASKAAVVSLTRSAAHEYGHCGVRVVAIAPGPIDTPMLRAADPEGKIIDAVPLHRIGAPEDIANAVAWLASDAASYVSGALLTVDGAFLAA